MGSIAGPFKQAVDAALRGSTALAAAGPRVAIYTEVPANAPLPYLVIGDDQVLPDTTGCAAEAEMFTTISWWARPSPPDRGGQARALGAAIFLALNARLDVAGWTLDAWECQSERYSTDPDQSTHGVAVFRYLATED